MRWSLQAKVQERRLAERWQEGAGRGPPWGKSRVANPALTLLGVGAGFMANGGNGLYLLADRVEQKLVMVRHGQHQAFGDLERLATGKGFGVLADKSLAKDLNAQRTVFKRQPNDFV